MLPQTKTQPQTNQTNNLEKLIELRCYKNLFSVMSSFWLKVVLFILFLLFLI